jgi:predicted 2-oxoglutarate/Fe(II)-dependent dioxygenase YbiX
MHTLKALSAPGVNESDSLDEDIGAGITTDYWRDLAMTEPDQPGGRIIFNSDSTQTITKPTKKQRKRSWHWATRIVMKTPKPGLAFTTLADRDIDRCCL